MRVVGLLWDMHRDLADSLSHRFAAIRHGFARYGMRQYSDEEVIALFGATEVGMFRDVVPDHWPEGQRDYLKENGHVHDTCASFPGLQKPSSACEIAASGSPSWQ